MMMKWRVLRFEPFAKFGDSVQHMVAHLPAIFPLPHPAFAALTPEWYELSCAKVSVRLLIRVLWRTETSQRILFNPSAREFNAAAKTFEWSAQDFGRFVDDLPRALRSPNGIEDIKGLFKKMSQNTSEFNGSQRELLAVSWHLLRINLEMVEILNAKNNKAVVESLEAQNKNLKVGFEQIRSGSSNDSSYQYGSIY